MITLKYSLSGIISYLLYLFLLIFSIEIFYIEKLSSSIIAYFIALIFNFIVLKLWVYKSNGKYKDQFIKYNIIACFGYFINSIGFFVLATIFEIHYLITQCILFLIVSILNFVLNTIWTFKVCKKQK